MDFALSDEQRLVQDNAASCLAGLANLESLRKSIESPFGWDAGLWATLAGELGFAGLMIPESYGGSGLGAVEMALVLEETGRRLAMVPFFETAVLATQTILRCGDAAQRQAWLPAIAAGRMRAAVAFAPTAKGGEARLRINGDGSGELSGEAGFVSFAHVADLLLVLARTPQGLRATALSAGTPGVRIERTPTMDLTRPMCTVSFDRVRIEPDQILRRADAQLALTIGAGLLAAEQSGGAAFCLSSTVDYAQQRVQFGRIIGSFQSIKHTLADMMVQVEAARSAAWYAAAAIDEGGEELHLACSAARAWCSDAFQFCASEAIQLHGGIGFTWEHHAHLYFKRARSTASWLGTPAEHREAVARLTGLGADAEAA